MDTIGEKIRYFRKLKNLSQEELAHQLDISLPAYSKIERNITDVNFSRLSQIVKILNISFIDLFQINNKNNPIQKENENLKEIIAKQNQEIIDLQRKIITLLDKKK